MGEKIKVVGNYKGLLDVELNKASTKGGNRWIHIQNEKFRLCLSESDFLAAAGAIIKAGHKFEEIKENK